MKKRSLLFVTIFCLAGSLMAQEEQKNYVQLSDPVEQTEAYRVFGSSFDGSIPMVTLDNLTAKPEEFDSKTVTTEGVIKQVCQKKGCFFILEDGQAARTVRIKFKDYSFFIPTNTAGSKVKLNGTFTVQAVSEEDARHYAKDTGGNPEAIDGPQKEYSLTATSVVIYK